MKTRIKVKTRLQGLDSIKNMERSGVLSSVLFKTGEWLKLRILRNWDQGRGASGDSLKALSPAYLKAKTETGVSTGSGKRYGEGIPNMTLTGQMRRALFVEKNGRKSITLTFREGEKAKARGNAKNRPTIMDADQDLARKTRDTFRRIARKQLGLSP